MVRGFGDSTLNSGSVEAPCRTPCAEFSVLSPKLRGNRACRDFQAKGSWRMMLWARSAPVEIMWIGVSVSSSIRSR